MSLDDFFLTSETNKSHSMYMLYTYLVGLAVFWNAARAYRFGVQNPLKLDLISSSMVPSHRHSSHSSGCSSVLFSHPTLSKHGNLFVPLMNKSKTHRSDLLGLLTVFSTSVVKPEVIVLLGGGALIPSQLIPAPGFSASRVIEMRSGVRIWQGKVFRCSISWNFRRSWGSFLGASR